MSYTPTEPIKTHSAAWHWEQAERYLSLASFLNQDPHAGTLEATHTVNPPLQWHFAELAKAHATLAAAGANILQNVNPHDPNARALREHATGNGTRKR